MVMVKSGCGPLGHGVLKSVSQEWIDELSWFFVYWCKFRKSKNYLNNYWMGVVKNVSDLHGTLKFSVSRII